MAGFAVNGVENSGSSAKKVGLYFLDILQHTVNPR
jgi:hypothetical protein